MGQVRREFRRQVGVGVVVPILQDDRLGDSIPEDHFFPEGEILLAIGRLDQMAHRLRHHHAGEASELVETSSPPKLTFQKGLGEMINYVH